MATVDLQQQPPPSKEYRMMNRGFPSLFDPDSDDQFSSESDSDGEEQARPSFLPLDEVIHEAPQSLAALLEVILPRIQPRVEVRGVSLEDQQSFVSVLVGELASQFSVIQHQIDDPFLSTQQNKELHKQIVVQVCKIIEEMYAQYLSKAARLERDGVFSMAANLSRIRAQLTLEANKSLNILAIRRSVLSKLRGSIPTITEPTSTHRHRRTCIRLPPIPKQELPQKSTPPNDASSREIKLDGTKVNKFGVRLESGTVRRKIRKLKSRLPHLKRKSLQPEEDSDDEQRGWETTTSTPRDHTNCQDPKSSFSAVSQMQRVPSMPELWGDFILCDIGLTTRHQRLEDKKGKHQLLKIHRAPSVDDIMDLRLYSYGSSQEKAVVNLGEYTQQDLFNDLEELKHISVSSNTSISNDDLHPLLQAHAHGLSEKKAQRLADYEAELRRGKEKAVLGDHLPSSGRSSSLDLSIPSVPTLEQLPYLTIEHTSRPSSSHDSMHVKSGPSDKSGGASLADSASIAPASTFDGVFAESGALETDDFEDQERWGYGGMSEATIHNAGDSRVLIASQLLGSSLQTGGDSMTHVRSSVLHKTYMYSGHVHQASGLSVNTSVHQSRLYQHLTQESYGGVSFDQPLSPVVGDDNVSEYYLESGGALLKEGQSNVQFESNVFSSAVSKCSVLEEGSGIRKEETHDETEVEAQEKEEEEQPFLCSHPQPAVISTRVNSKDVVRTSDIRVSDRTPLFSLRLKQFEPIYNELTGEMTRHMMEELDSTLHEGKETAAIYEEIMKTLSTGHLQFDQEPTLEPSIESPVELSKILASNTLHHRRARRVMNSRLYRSIGHPWPEDTNRKEWEISNQYKGPDLKHFGLKPGSGTRVSPRHAHILRGYNTWQKWWKSLLDSEDYLKFASREESDYLRLLYHLYDSDGSDSEAEEEQREKKARLAALEAKLKEKEERIQQRYKEKSHFEKGTWNVNTVVMGGLGGDPEISSSDEDDEEVHQEDHSPEAIQSSLQEVWTRLFFPPSQQIDMAIKYSSHRHRSQLKQILELWETVCVTIEKRELLLSQLESFEKKASDPTRFFARGHRGSSVVRLEEAKKRAEFHKELDKLDGEVSQIVRKLQIKFGDIVTYKGRPYSDKMSSDRTEMLYWLQQERRRAVLNPAVKTIIIPPILIENTTS